MEDPEGLHAAWAAAILLVISAVAFFLLWMEGCQPQRRAATAMRCGSTWNYVMATFGFYASFVSFFWIPATTACAVAHQESLRLFVVGAVAVFQAVAMFVNNVEQGE